MSMTYKYSSTCTLAATIFIQLSIWCGDNLRAAIKRRRRLLEEIRYPVIPVYLLLLLLV